MHDAFQLLRAGRLTEARRVLEGQLRAHRADALRGLLGIAELRRDRRQAERLLGQVSAAGEPPELLLAAAQCASALSLFSRHATALMARACELVRDARFDVEAQAICARLAVTERGEKLARCVAGAAAEHRLPLDLFSSQPVIHASINGHPPAAFLLDTGASVSVLTRRYAASIGARAAAGAAYRVDSPGGLLATELARVDVTLGELAFADVPFALLDLPLPSLAGILSPQALLSGFVVEIDLRDFMLRVGPRNAREEKAARVAPLVMVDGRPFVPTALGERPERYFLLDTGADTTRMHESYALDASDQQPHEVGRMLTAGDRSARTWVLEGRTPARTLGVDWSIDAPSVVAEPAVRPLEIVVASGTIGTDFLMGRILTLDMVQRELSVSAVAELAAWPEGAEALYELSGSALKAPMTIGERVQARQGAEVVLEVQLHAGQESERFRIGMQDTWQTRGGFLLTRPGKQAWLEQDGRFVPVARSVVDERWSSAFFPFQPKSTPPRITPRGAVLQGQSLRCTQTEVDVDSPAGEATLRLVTCPEQPWRTLSVEIARADEVLFRYRRRGLSVQ